MKPARLKTLIDAATIQRRVAELGLQIHRDFAEDEALVLIGVLKGAWVFLADLARAIPRPVHIDFLATSSYGKQKSSSGEVKLMRDLDESIEGRHVILVEDIVDTGITLTYLMRILEQRKPKSICIAGFLDKPARRQREVPIAYRGFEVPDEFVVGYGLDFAGDYRNLPDVCAIVEDGASH